MDKKILPLQAEGQPFIKVSKTACSDKKQEFIHLLNEILPSNQEQCVDEKKDTLRGNIFNIYASTVNMARRSVRMQIALMRTFRRFIK